MTPPTLIFPLAGAEDEARVHAFLQAQLPHLPGAMNAFWPPQTTPLDILSGLNTAEAWLVLADDQLIGVGALHYHHLSTWRAFLLCDPSWAPQLLPELQHALQQVIFQFRYLIPESRRPAMSQVVALLPDGPHLEGLEAAYQAAGWQPHTSHLASFIDLAFLDRAALADVHPQAAQQGVTVECLSTWTRPQRRAFLSSLPPSTTRVWHEHRTWVAHLHGTPVAVNAWQLAVDGLTSQLDTEPLWLTSTPQADLIRQALAGTLLQSGPPEPGRRAALCTREDPEPYQSWLSSPGAPPLHFQRVQLWEFDFQTLAARAAAFESFRKRHWSAD